MSLRLGLAQIAQTADREANRARILGALEEASAAGVQLLCFPEAQTVGYRAGIVDPGAAVPGEWLEQVHAEVASRCADLGLACVLGTEMPSESAKPYNSALVIDERGRILGAHHKTILTPADAAAYERGRQQHTFELCGVRVGVAICFEAFRFAETTAECVRQGAQLVLHPQNNTTEPSDWKLPVFRAMAVTRAAENTVWFATCNACLEMQNSRSLIVAPDGTIAAQGELKVEQLVVADIDPALATRAMFLVAEAARAGDGDPLQDTTTLLRQLHW